MALNNQGEVDVGNGDLSAALENLLFQGTIRVEDVQTLGTAGIRSFKDLKKNQANGVTGIANATFGYILEECTRVKALRIAEENIQKTASNIGKMHQRYCYQKTKKRLEVLVTAIAIDHPDHKRRIAHWVRERDACIKRLANMRNNN